VNNSRKVQNAIDKPFKNADICQIFLGCMYYSLDIRQGANGKCQGFDRDSLTAFNPNRKSRLGHSDNIFIFSELTQES